MQLPRDGAEHRRRGRDAAKLEGADVVRADARSTALIIRIGTIVVARVDRGAAGEKGVGESAAAVVLQRTEQRIGVADIASGSSGIHPGPVPLESAGVVVAQVMA